MIAKLSRLRKKRESSQAKRVFVFIAFLTVGLLAVLLLFYNINLYQRRGNLAEQTQQLKEKIGELAEESRELQEEAAVQETLAYQERILREQGLFQKPGEEVVTILPAEELLAGGEKKEWTWWNPFTWVEWVKDN